MCLACAEAWFQSSAPSPGEKKSLLVFSQCCFLSQSPVITPLHSSPAFHPLFMILCGVLIYLTHPVPGKGTLCFFVTELLEVNWAGSREHCDVRKISDISSLYPSWLYDPLGLSLFLLIILLHNSHSNKNIKNVILVHTWVTLMTNSPPSSSFGQGLTS